MISVLLRAIAVMKARSPTDIVYQLTYVDHPLLIITHILSCGRAHVTVVLVLVIVLALIAVPHASCCSVVCRLVD